MAEPAKAERPATADGDSRTPDRAATEAALEKAALTLLRRDGVLAGLNLREVAEEARVNRGLLYHYYGSRQKLLRRALRRQGQTNRDELAASEHLPAPRRWQEFFRTTIAHPDPIALTTLLVLDGTEQFRTMPLRDRVQDSMRRDKAEGTLAADVDTTALHALLVTGAYGYALYREPFARELGIDLEELDERVLALLGERFLPALSPEPEPPPPTDSGGDPTSPTTRGTHAI